MSSRDTAAAGASITGPILETERLAIRPFRAEDGADLFEYLSLPETYRFEPGLPLSLEAARRLAAERAGQDCFLAVALKEGPMAGKLIGHLYFQLQDPVEFRTWELGYIFNPAFQGRGYCTEAARILIRHAFAHRQAHRVVAFCDPLNPASWRVLEKCGMQREGLFRQKAFFRRDAKGQALWHDCLAYGILEGVAGDRPASPGSFGAGEGLPRP
jgi:RimJ/RimL family protein N-acetyltransferase